MWIHGDTNNNAINKKAWEKLPKLLRMRDTGGVLVVFPVSMVWSRVFCSSFLLHILKFPGQCSSIFALFPSFSSCLTWFASFIETDSSDDEEDRDEEDPYKMRIPVVPDDQATSWMNQGKPLWNSENHNKNPIKQRNRCHQNPHAPVLAGGGTFFSKMWFLGCFA